MLRPSLLLLPLLLCAGEAVPTGEEQLLLDIVNLHRADRRAVDRIIANTIYDGVVKDVSAREWIKAGDARGEADKMTPLPPVVFNPQLIAAARKLLAAGTTPPKEKAFDPAPAMREAGYAEARGVVMIGIDAPSLPEIYGKAAVNIIGRREDKKDAQPRFTVRQALNVEWREIGIAAAKGKGGYSAVFIFGPGSATRHIGGMVYADANRNLAYDPGEGKAGVTITVGGQTATTGAHGVWWLALPDANGGEVKMAGNGHGTAQKLEAKPVNQVFAWRLPDAADIKAADALMAAVQKAGADPAKLKAAQGDLLIGTLKSALDDERRAKVTALVEPIREDFVATRTKLMEQVTEEPKTYRAQVEVMRKVWYGAMPAWFKEAEGLATLYHEVVKVQRAPLESREKLAAPARKALDKAIAGNLDPVFLEQYKTWSDSLAAALAEEPPAKPKKK